MRVERGFLLAVGLMAGLASAGMAANAQAQDSSAPAAGEASGDTTVDQRVWHHALSLIGKPQYPADFTHFDWVNPDAPKGGVVRLWSLGGYDTLNPFPSKGDPAAGLAVIFDSLMDTSLDESSTEYGLIASEVSYPDDYSSVTFRLRPEARFHDGAPIRPEDVIFSLNELKRVSPAYAFYYKNVVTAEKAGEHEVTFKFDVTGNRELPQIVGQLTILPEHYWTGKDASGEVRNLEKSTLEPPLGSGAYRIDKVEPNRRIVYKRVADYWAKDLPVMRGRSNFDEIRIEFFRDKTVAFEAFKNGAIDFWRESSAKDWATQFEFQAFKDGFVKREAIELDTPEAMQSFAFNIRRPQFKDPRVRRAFNFAFDFEWANKNLFYDQYVRTDSYFENQDLAAGGLPGADELAILEPLRGKIPDEVFTTEYTNPVGGDPQKTRANLREATRLLNEAGWSIRDEEIEDPDCGFFCRIMVSVGLRSAKTERILRNDKGEAFEVEFLLVQPDFERIVLPFIQGLERLGIKARARVVDTAQYQRRYTERDFDIVIASFAQSESPGNEQRDFWGSDAADRDGSRNVIGIKDPAIDALIDRIIFAKDRAELVAATKALDRVLLWNHFVVPQWFISSDRVAWWDKYRRPEKLPRLSTAFQDVWWYDAEAASKLEAAKK